MVGTDGTNDVPHIENGSGVVVIVVDTTNPETNDTCIVIDTPPWVPGKEGIVYDIVEYPLVLDMVIGW
jgi:hypothetical protein